MAETEAMPIDAAPAAAAVDDKVKATNGTAPSTSKGVDELENESDADKETSVLRQIQFYLGDSNLPFDKFLFGLSQESLEEEAQKSSPGTGWVSIEKLASFKRMQPYRDFTPSRIADVLRERGGPLLEVEGTRVRRSEPISLQRSSGQVDRSVYAKGFPLDEQGDKLQEHIERFFNRFYATNAVRMRREGGNQPAKPRAGPRGAFKGSVFVEFATAEDCKAFLAQDPPPTFPGQDAPLEVLSKRAYIDKKAEEHDVKADHRDNISQKRFNAFTELKRGGGTSSGDRRTTLHYRDQDLETSNGKLVNADALELKDDDAKYLLRYDGVKTVDRFALQDQLLKVAETGFVELPSREHDEGYIAFKTALTDAEYDDIVALDLADKDGAKFVWHRVDADQTKAYHIRRATYLARRADEGDSGYTRGGGRGGRGGRGRGAGGGGGDRGGRGRGRGGSKGGDRGSGGRRDRNEEKEAAPAAETKADAPAKAATNGDAAPTVAASGELGARVESVKRKAEDEGAPAAKKAKTAGGNEV